jgi:anti-anti-sigma factor
MAESEIAVEWVDVRAAVVRLIGEHDMTTVPHLRQQLQSLSERAAAVVLELSDAEFIDSSVIHALTEADQLLRERGRRLVVCCRRTAIAERVLKIVEPDVPVLADPSEALALALQVGGGGTRGS